jgi:hypothetical protein
MGSSNIQGRYDIDDETPFFVPKEAHKEDEKNCGPSKCLDPIIAQKANRDERQSGHEKAREENCEVGPERRYLGEVTNEMIDQRRREHGHPIQSSCPHIH